MKISVQHEDFDMREETELLRSRGDDVGAIVTFTGLVRDFDKASDKSKKVNTLTLEHYPGMTEKSLQDIVTQAEQRWPLLDATVIHRIGELKPADQIVFVAASSHHRNAAFSACEFIMDFLKTRAPFWKKCKDEKGEYWVEVKESDVDAEGKW